MPSVITSAGEGSVLRKFVLHLICATKLTPYPLWHIIAPKSNMLSNGSLIGMKA